MSLKQLATYMPFILSKEGAPDKEAAKEAMINGIKENMDTIWDSLESNGIIMFTYNKDWITGKKRED